MFSATHFLKGLSCLNSPGTPQQLFAALRRQPNSTEKSVNATISCAEQRPFKTPQLPALRAVVSEPAQQKRRFFLLLYFQRVGSPSILGENVFQQLSLTSATRCRQGLQTCLGRHGCHHNSIHPTQRLTGHRGGSLFALCPSAHRLQGRCGPPPDTVQQFRHFTYCLHKIDIPLIAALFGFC